MNKVFLFSLLYIFGVIISAIAQVLLKKAANKNVEEKNSTIKEYLNLRTIVAYGVFFGATLCTVFSYKYIPLAMGPILGASEYIFVAILGRFWLKEKITKQKMIGLIIIVIGIVVFSL